MARTLGVVCTTREVLFATAEDGALVDGLPERVKTPALYEQSEGLLAAVEEIRRAIAAIGPKSVRLLLAEQMYKDTYPRIAPRSALETLVRMACAQEDLPVELVYPNSARARLGVDRKGSFDDAIAKVLPNAVGKYWSRGRNRAAAAALMSEG